MPEVATKPPPPALENPVLKPEYLDSAKSIFNEARKAEGLDTPKDISLEPDPEPEPAPEPVPDTTVSSTATPPPAEAAAKPRGDNAAVLPEDIFKPAEPEKPKTNEAIAAIEAMELPKGAKEKTVSGFQELKKKSIEEIQKASAKVEELERKIAAATSNADIEKLNEKLKAAELKAAEIEDQWAKASLETSPVFQRQFIARERDALDRAKKFLEGTEVDPRIVEIAANSSGAKRLEILENAGLDTKIVNSIDSRLDRYDEIQKEKQIALENWRGQAAQWQEQQQQAAEAEKAKRSEQENRVFDAVVADLRNSLLPLRKSKDESWNAVADQIITEAKEAYNGKGMPLKLISEVFVRGVADKHGIKDKVIEQLTEKNRLLNEENSKLRSAAPGGTITQSTTTAPTKDQSKMSADERAKATFNEQMAAARG